MLDGELKMNAVWEVVSAEIQMWRVKVPHLQVARVQMGQLVSGHSRSIILAAEEPCSRERCHGTTARVLAGQR